MSVLVVQSTTPSLEISRTQPVIVLSAALLNSGTVGGVTSVGMTVPSDLTVTGSPVTGAGTLALSRNTQSANQFLAGPSSGVAAVPAYRAIVAGDIPQLTGAQMPALTGDVTSTAGTAATTLAASGVTAGTYGSGSAVPVLTLDAKGRVTAASTAAVVSGSGTVTSVGLSDLTGLFTITGSPVTTSGTLTLSALASQAANKFLAAPNGAAGAPTMRTIVPADVPVFGASGASHAAGAVPDPGATAGTTRFLREDATWAAPAGGGASGAGVQHLPPSLGANYSFAANCVYPWPGVSENLLSGYGTFVPFMVDRSVTVTQLGFWYNSTNANTVYVGIYSDAGNTPGTLLVSGSVAASAAQQYTVSVASTTLSAGTLYWAAILLPTTSSAIFGSSTPIFSLGSTMISGSTSGVVYTYRHQSGLASLPATAATNIIGTGNFPIIAFNG